MVTEAEALKKLGVVTATIERVRVDTDPEVDVFELTLKRGPDDGIWTETARSPEELTTMLRLAKAGVTMANWRFEQGEVPQEPTRYLVDKK